MGILGDGVMAAESEELVIPSSWFQRLTRNQMLTLIGAVLAGMAWLYDMSGDFASLKERVARTEAKLEALDKKFAERDRDMSITLATLGVSLVTIDKRLSSIELNVRKMAQ